MNPNAEWLAAQAGKVAQQEELPTPDSRAFTIAFRNPRYADLFLEQMNIADPIVVKDANTGIIGGFAHNPEVLQHVLHKARSFQSAFTEAMMETLSGEHWLHTYHDMVDGGIDYASEQHHASTRDQLLKDMEKTLEHRTTMLNHQVQTRYQHHQASKMTFQCVVDDLSDFIIHNCEGYGSEAKVSKAITSLVKKLEAESADTLLIDTHYTQNISFALDDYCTHQLEKAEGDQGRKSISVLQNQSKYTELSDKSRNDKTRLYSEMLPYAESYLKKNFPDLTLKGLDQLFDDADADIQLTKPFNGLGMTSLGTGSFADRVDPQYLRYRIQDQGETFHECLGANLVSYVYNLLQYRHEDNHEQALIEFSKHIGDKQYYDHAVELLEASRTRLFQGQQLDREGPLEMP